MDDLLTIPVDNSVNNTWLNQRFSTAMAILFKLFRVWSNKENPLIINSLAIFQ